MTLAKDPKPDILQLPDHTQLPDSDGTFVKNFQEHPQSVMLTTSIKPVLQRLHPDGRYCIGQDSGIYWRLTDPPEKGAEAPDWFYVPNVPYLVKGEMRRSYVLWKEYVAPLIAIEFVSGDGSEERDRTSPNSTYEPTNNGGGAKISIDKAGKFWVYEQAIRIAYYAIYEVTKASVEVYCLTNARYQLVSPNERGHYPIPPMDVELGIWQGSDGQQELPWLRWWDSEGNLLLTGEERAEQETRRAEQETRRAEQETRRAEQETRRAEQEARRADRLAERLRELGLDPDEL